MGKRSGHIGERIVGHNSGHIISACRKMGILVSILVGIIVGISMGILVGILVGRLVGRQARRGGQSTPEMQRLPHDCIELLGQCKLHRASASCTVLPPAVQPPAARSVQPPARCWHLHSAMCHVPSAMWCVVHIEKIEMYCSAAEPPLVRCE